MALIELILVTAAILIIVWIFITLIKSTMKVIGSILLGIFLLLFIGGALFYLDYRELKEGFEGEENLLVLHKNESIILSSSLIVEEEGNQTFNISEGKSGEEVMELIEGNETNHTYNMIITVDETLLREGLDDSIEILGENVSKDIYFDILHGEIDSGAFSSITEREEIEEKIRDFIGNEINPDSALQKISFIVGLNEVRKEKGYRWLLEKYSEEQIEIIPEPFLLKLTSFF